MKDATSKNQSRRKFLSLGLLTAGMVTGKLNAQALSEPKETIQMLTSDGKLVSVDKTLIHDQSVKKQATKKDVMGWVHGDKS